MESHELFAMLCREHDRATGGDQVWPGQNWRDPDGGLWSVSAIATHGGERTAIMTDADGSALHLPAALVARQYHFVGATPPARGRDDADGGGHG